MRWLIHEWCYLHHPTPKWGDPQISLRDSFDLTYITLAHYTLPTAAPTHSIIAVHFRRRWWTQRFHRILGNRVHKSWSHHTICSFPPRVLKTEKEKNNLNFLIPDSHSNLVYWLYNTTKDVLSPPHIS